jgi:hypothetical protein
VRTIPSWPLISSRSPTSSRSSALGYDASTIQAKERAAERGYVVRPGIRQLLASK